MTATEIIAVEKYFCHFERTSVCCLTTYVIRQTEFRPKVQNLSTSDDGLITIGKQIKNNKTLCILQGVFFVFILR